MNQVCTNLLTYAHAAPAVGTIDDVDFSLDPWDDAGLLGVFGFRCTAITNIAKP